jgi:hypothetical protein
MEQTATRGGKRLGAGRKRGLASIRAEEARKYTLDVISRELDPILAGQIALAKGIYFETEDDEGNKTIYRRLPDTKAALFLINQLIGTPKETNEITITPKFSLVELARQANELQTEREQNPEPTNTITLDEACEKHPILLEFKKRFVK